MTVRVVRMNECVQRRLALELAVREDRRVRPLIPPDHLGDEVVTAVLMDPDADAEDFVRGTGDPAVARFAYARDYDVEEAREYIADINEHRRERGESIQFALRDAQTGAFLGCLLFAGIDWDRATAVLGFWLMPEARGRGIMRRTIILGFDWMASLGIERISAQTDVANVGAQRAMEAAGFTREGILRGANPGPDGRVDYVAYARLASDPRPSTEPTASATRAT
jgi:RimJ/RimL family protein N-acetyltransferase